MPFLDDQGRLFGRMNLIDAAVAVFVFALLPLAYASWVLFRMPDPTIKAVTGTVLPDRANQYIAVQGANLRPYLRASIGGVPATFLYETSDRCQVELPPLAPGTYYLAFFDEAKKIVEFPNAVTVLPRGPAPKMALETVTPRELDYGRTIRQAELRGQFLRSGLRVVIGTTEGNYQYLSANRAVISVPALEPGTYDLALLEGSVEVARLPRALTIRAEKLVEVRLLVRFVTRPEVVQMIQRVRRQASERRPPSTPPRPVLESYQVIEEVVGSTKQDVVEGRLTVVHGTVRVMANSTADGWQFEGRPLRAGASFTLTAPEYELVGAILNLEVGGGRVR